MRAASSSLCNANTRLPIPVPNFQLCHITTKFNPLSLKIPFPSYPIVQICSLNSHHHKKLPTSRITSSRSLVIEASSMASSTESETKTFSVLFVCLGNICRSPAAEGVFTDIVKKRGLDSKFKIDSAGTIGYHEVCPYIK